MMRAESSSLGRLPAGVAVLLLVTVASLPNAARGDAEPPTAWTEDPPLMTTEKVLSAEKDNVRVPFQDLLRTLRPKQAGFSGLEEVDATRKPIPATDSSRQPDEKLGQEVPSGRSERSKDGNGDPALEPGQQATNVTQKNSLKFVPAQNVVHDQIHAQQKEVPETSRPSSSDSKTTTRDNAEASPGAHSDPPKESSAGSPVLSGSVGQPSDMLPEISVVVGMEDSPWGDVFLLLGEGLQVLQSDNNEGSPIPNALERHGAVLGEVNPNVKAVDDSRRDPGFFLRMLGARRLLPPNFQAEYGTDVLEELNRIKRDVPKTQTANENGTLTVVPGYFSSKVNSTPAQEKRGAAPVEELKISRIGYIIFGKDGKIKEAKEASVSELNKSANRTDKLQRNHSKNFLQMCRHGNFIHPVGQPPHEPQRQGEGGMKSGAGKQVEVRVPDLIQANRGKGAFPSETDKLPNSIEVLTIREDIGKGMPRKDFSDWYEMQGNGQSSKDHRHSSVLSAFHVLLITAICILTFVTILYLSSKIRSDNGGPRRLNSHTTLFEPHTKYERY